MCLGAGGGGGGGEWGGGGDLILLQSLKDYPMFVQEWRLFGKSQYRERVAASNESDAEKNSVIPILCGTQSSSFKSSPDVSYLHKDAVCFGCLVLHWH